MQIDPSLLTVITAVVTVGAWLFTRYTADREKETRKDIDALKQQNEKLGDNLKQQNEKLTAQVHELEKRLVEEEKATIRQDGEVKLIEQGHDNVSEDLAEMKSLLNKVLEELRRSPTRAPPGPPYASPGPGAYRTHPSGGYEPTRKDPNK